MEAPQPPAQYKQKQTQSNGACQQQEQRQSARIEYLKPMTYKQMPVPRMVNGKIEYVHQDQTEQPTPSKGSNPIREPQRNENPENHHMAATHLPKRMHLNEEELVPKQPNKGGAQQK